MPNPEENQPTEITGSPLPTQTATVVSNHEGEDGMGSRSMTMARYEEIRRRLAEGRGLREIARALNCSRDTVREVRDGARQSPDAPNCYRIRCGCCSWIGPPLFTIWGSVIR
jgi:hypothetical protein